MRTATPEQAPGQVFIKTRQITTQRTLAEHRAILDALESHDPAVARSWSTVHIASVQQWLAPVL